MIIHSFVATLSESTAIKPHLHIALAYCAALAGLGTYALRPACHGDFPAGVKFSEGLLMLSDGSSSLELSCRSGTPSLKMMTESGEELVIDIRDSLVNIVLMGKAEGLSSTVSLSSGAQIGLNISAEEKTRVKVGMTPFGAELSMRDIEGRDQISLFAPMAGGPLIRLQKPGEVERLLLAIDPDEGPVVRFRTEEVEIQHP